MFIFWVSWSRGESAHWSESIYSKNESLTNFKDASAEMRLNRFAKTNVKWGLPVSQTKPKVFGVAMETPQKGSKTDQKKGFLERSLEKLKKLTGNLMH